MGTAHQPWKQREEKPEFVEILNIFFLSFPFTFHLSTHSKDSGWGSTPLVLWWFRIPPPGAGQPRSSELELVMGCQETPGVPFPCAPCSSLRLLSCPGIPNGRCCRPAATQSPGDESIRIFRAENKWVTTITIIIIMMVGDTKNSPITGGRALADHRTSRFLSSMGHEQNWEWKLNGSLMNLLIFGAKQ